MTPHMEALSSYNVYKTLSMLQTDSLSHCPCYQTVINLDLGISLVFYRGLCLIINLMQLIKDHF